MKARDRGRKSGTGLPGSDAVRRPGAGAIQRSRGDAPQGSGSAAPPGPKPRRAAPGTWRRWRLGLGVAIVLAIIGGWTAIQLKARSRFPAAHFGDLSLSSAALFDSVSALSGRHDWEHALLYSNQLSHREPSNPTALLTLATAWNNFAWSGGTFERARSPVRTSLERVRIFTRSFALLDSAMAVDPTPEVVVDIRRTRGQLYELVGLPTDALAIYLDLLRRAPSDRLTLGRRAWVQNHLRDPVTTDDEWMRRAEARGERKR